MNAPKKGTSGKSPSGGGGKSSKSTSAAAASQAAKRAAAAAAVAAASEKALPVGIIGSGAHPTAHILPHFSGESMKIIAESVNVGNMGEEALRVLAENATNAVKMILKNSVKYSYHAKRTRLYPVDVDYSLKNANYAPVYGFSAPSFIPFRYASGGGREVYFQEDKELDISEIVHRSSVVKIPPAVALRGHWLAIDGIQPAVPENPPPLSREEQLTQSTDPSRVLRGLSATDGKTTAGGGGGGEASTSKAAAAAKDLDPIKRQVEFVQLKQLATHELSVEQQLYYKEITEACVGSDESRRSEALASLQNDPGLYQLIPRLANFISEGVKVNVCQNNLALLIYLMRMVKALLENPNIFLERYLHELLPTVITCIVSKQLCNRPDVDNHWALRDFASKQLKEMCAKFNSPTNNIQTRVSRLMVDSLDKPHTPLSSVYGSLSALCELGTDVINQLVCKRVRPLGDRIKPIVEEHSMPADKTAAENIIKLATKHVGEAIRTTRRPISDLLEDYRAEFGYMGMHIHGYIMARKSITPNLISSSSASSSGLFSQAARPGLPMAVPGARPNIIGAAGGQLRGISPAIIGGQRRISGTLISSSPGAAATSSSMPTSTGPRILLQPSRSAAAAATIQAQAQYIRLPPTSGGSSGRFIYVQPSQSNSSTPDRGQDQT